MKTKRKNSIERFCGSTLFQMAENIKCKTEYINVEKWVNHTESFHQSLYSTPMIINNINNSLCHL